MWALYWALLEEAEESRVVLERVVPIDIRIIDATTPPREKPLKLRLSPLPLRRARRGDAVGINIGLG